MAPDKSVDNKRVFGSLVDILLLDKSGHYTNVSFLAELAGHWYLQSTTVKGGQTGFDTSKLGSSD